MTAKRRLVPPAEVEEHIELLKKLGVQIGSVDIRADGVTIHPANANQRVGDAADEWFRKDAGRDQASHRP